MILDAHEATVFLVGSALRVHSPLMSRDRDRHPDRGFLQRQMRRAYAFSGGPEAVLVLGVLLWRSATGAIDSRGDVLAFRTASADRPYLGRLFA